MKKRLCYLLVILITVLIAGCSSHKQKLTLDIVTELAQKGEELSWSDFEQYESEDVGSGLYILHYDIDEAYYLIIGGGSMEQKPMYMRLVKKANHEDYIDIRTDDVEEFISYVAVDSNVWEELVKHPNNLRFYNKDNIDISEQIDR